MIICAANADGEIHQSGHGEDVEEGYAAKKAFLALKGEIAKPGMALLHIDRKVGMREHRALGRARGASRILENRDIGRLDGGSVETAVIVLQFAR